MNALWAFLTLLAVGCTGLCTYRAGRGLFRWRRKAIAGAGPQANEKVMTHRTMYDSTNLDLIPATAEMVASYLTGFPQSQAQWDRFKGKVRIRIVQHSGVYNEGDVLDVEGGAAGIGDVLPFIEQRKAAGYHRPTIYTSLSNVANVRHAAGKYVLGVDYDLWVASWTPPTPHQAYPGAAATQYKHLGSYDISVVYDPGWPHRKAGPTPPPHPKPPANVYKNPLRAMTGLVPERIDQGVDYAGTGPIYALGPGVVVNTLNAGWPGGAFICCRITEGRYTGKYVFYAEDIHPVVSIGDHVTADTIVGHVFAGGSGIEIGWAAPPGSGETMARAHGQVGSPDPGSVSSAYGHGFSQVIKSVGGPPGKLQGKIVGTAPAGYFPSGITPPPPPPPPPPHDGPYRHVANGQLSLNAIMQHRDSDPAEIVRLTVNHALLAEAEVFAHYILGGADKPMPKGTVYYTENP